MTAQLFVDPFSLKVLGRSCLIVTTTGLCFRTCVNLQQRSSGRETLIGYSCSRVVYFKGTKEQF